jgi:branched-chain amino acid transport system substrate-binding protein
MERAMRTRSRRGRAAAALALCLLGGSATACGDSADASVRVGVLTDCEGFFRASGDAMIRGAEVPFLTRGATINGPNPGDGVSGIRIGGREVELVDGCVEGGEYTTLIRAARHLVEKDHVSAVVGGSWPGDGLVLRELARTYPDVAFVVANAGPREVTLRHSVRNLFRFAPDAVQSTAGLGSYAADVRGWRSAAVVTTDREIGWQAEAAFAAEFCAAGGTVSREALVPWYQAADPKQLQATIARPGVDGVVILGTPGTFPAQVLVDVVREAGGVDRVLLGPEFSLSRADFTEFPAELDGIAGVSPWQVDGPALDRYRQAYRDHFPSETDESMSASVVGMRDGVEAVLRGLELASDGGSSVAGLVDSLRHATIDGVGGATVLDESRQAVATTRIVRYQNDSGGLTTTEVQRRADVDPSLGGRLPLTYEPQSGGQGCASVGVGPP